MNEHCPITGNKYPQIRLVWILLGAAALTAWFSPSAHILYFAVIGLMAKEIHQGNEHLSFETAALLLMFAGTGLVLSIILTTAIGGKSGL